MKILLGGIPLGCDNIGDEAILASVVGLLRSKLGENGCEITVATRDQEHTAAVLKVRTIALYGFDLPAESIPFAEFDLFLWCGATGLSDYPETGCRLLRAARRAKTPAAIWCVGMNDQFNPAFYVLHGRRGRLADLLHLRGILEKWMVWHVRSRIAAELQNLPLVVMRDEPSRVELRRCAAFPDAIYAADTALLQTSSPYPRPEALAPGRKVLGVCISAQRRMAGLDEFAAMLDDLIQKEDFQVLFLPMNSKTDAELMAGLQAKMRERSRTVLATATEPGEIQTLTSYCDVIVSSRLHLMILGLNVLVPCVGIARGSKIANYLEQYDLPVAGSVDCCDFAVLRSQIVRLAAEKSTFVQNASAVRKQLLDRMDAASERLTAVIRHLENK
ncbi:MAG: polysaccharide pyruvyl transferase family protein [Victivallaceae bacterium]|nr:polysaccharide pyruvyl transferase family protein [Victivallaceae bacterium]